MDTLIADSVRVSPTEKIHQPFTEEFNHLQGWIKEYRTHFPGYPPGKSLTKPERSSWSDHEEKIILGIFGVLETGGLSIPLIYLGVSSEITTYLIPFLFIVSLIFGKVICTHEEEGPIRDLKSIDPCKQSRLEAGHAWMREGEDHTQYSVTVTGFQDQVSIKLLQHRPRQSGFTQKVVAERIFRGDETALAASCKALFERRAARYEAESQAQSLIISQQLQEVALDYEMELQAQREAEEQACQLVRALGGTIEKS
jgi:hypothetical protein